MQKGGFRCPACGGEFESREKLDDHTSKAHGQQKGGMQPPKR